MGSRQPAIMSTASASALALNNRDNEEDRENFREAFKAFDWNNSGNISYSNLQAAMRRCGHNPTDIEVSDIINKIHDDTGSLDLQEFYKIMERRTRELDPETGYKECFRVFSKDQDGCITAEEMKYVGSLSCWIMFMLYSRFVLMHLPGKITYKEID